MSYTHSLYVILCFQLHNKLKTESTFNRPLSLHMTDSSYTGHLMTQKTKEIKIRKMLDMETV